jgi:hypothetical protein
VDRHLPYASHRRNGTVPAGRSERRLTAAVPARDAGPVIRLRFISHGVLVQFSVRRRRSVSPPRLHPKERNYVDLSLSIRLSATI